MFLYVMFLYAMFLYKCMSFLYIMLLYVIVRCALLRERHRQPDSLQRRVEALPEGVQGHAVSKLLLSRLLAAPSAQ